MKHDLMGPGVTAADVLAATECVMPCFEIVDSRIRDWKIKIQDTVADNASLRRVRARRPRWSIPRAVDLATCGMVLEKNGEIVATGAGAAALGRRSTPWPGWPTRSGGSAFRCKAGEVVLSGSLGADGPGQGRRQPARHHRRHRRLLGALLLTNDNEESSS